MKAINPLPAPRRECYGKIFPEREGFRINKPNAGKVFGVFLQSWGVGVQHEEVTFDETQWDACTRCPDFEGCYRLSMAKLALGGAVRDRLFG